MKSRKISLIIALSSLAMLTVAGFSSVGYAKWTVSNEVEVNQSAKNEKVIPAWGFKTKTGYTIDTNGKVTGYDGDKENVNIPATDDEGNPVTSIGNLGLDSDTETVTIPASVTHIDEDAFVGARSGPSTSYYGETTEGCTITYGGTRAEFEAAGGEEAIKAAGQHNAENDGDEYWNAGETYRNNRDNPRNPWYGKYLKEQYDPTVHCSDDDSDQGGNP